MSQPVHDQSGQPDTAGSPSVPPAPYEGWAPPSPETYAAQPPTAAQAPYVPPMRPHPHPGAGQLGLVALALAGILTLVEIGEALVAWPSEEQLKAALAAGRDVDTVLTPLDALALPWILAGVAAWIVTAIWLTRARENAEALHPLAPHDRSKVWAWLGWIVPVVSLWFPRQFVRDVRAATVSEERKYSTVVGWWWAMWLAQFLTGQAADRMTMNASGGVDGLGAVESVSAILALVAFVLWARIVLEVRTDQQAVALGRPTVPVVR